MKRLVACLLLLPALSFAQDDIKLVQLYSQDELLKLIDANAHLDRMVTDRCQLVQDVEARAMTLKLPAFQFLFGDMLAWGVCVERDAERGIYYMKQAAEQGMPAAMEQLGRYYAQGKLVQQDKERAVVYLREASSMGNLKAQIQLAELFIDGYGSPYDFEDAYRWLYGAITADDATHKRISRCLTKLETLMHPKAVRAAKQAVDS
ncbi:tetratricopeptide repeat protein [Bowmanella sp. JS7-9]|uniref:Tetratricopeptide repeat protein n=1 Tax=Pseudobowmanella zhangzhouensis TaxID=1537679 RepID=A0ABW1XF03_9ALTE|nr:tetratricopeptide repeat protein [Bowmanella sp. JS7-9]